MIWTIDRAGGTGCAAGFPLVWRCCGRCRRRLSPRALGGGDGRWHGNAGGRRNHRATRTGGRGWSNARHVRRRLRGSGRRCRRGCWKRRRLGGSGARWGLRWRNSLGRFAYGCSGTLRGLRWRSSLGRFAYGCSGTLWSLRWHSSLGQLAYGGRSTLWGLRWRSSLGRFDYGCSGTFRGLRWRNSLGRFAYGGSGTLWSLCWRNSLGRFAYGGLRWNDLPCRFAGGGRPGSSSWCSRGNLIVRGGPRRIDRRDRWLRIVVLPQRLVKGASIQGGIGRSGCASSAVSVSGSTRVGVTITTNSVFEWLTFFDLNSAPRIGMSQRPASCS
jgi:hypothetical protein